VAEISLRGEDVMAGFLVCPSREVRDGDSHPAIRFQSNEEARYTDDGLAQHENLRTPMIMKRYLTCIAVVGLLSACTQVQSLRDSPATGYYVGDRSVDEVVACVSGSWSKRSAQMGVVPMFGGTSIQLRDGADGPMVALVDIVATGPTTTAKYYAKAGQDAWFSEQVMDCMHATSSIN
jgi:hypothetical protein